MSGSEREGEREKEKNSLEHERARELDIAKQREREHKEAGMQTGIDTGKALADISADERFYQRSVKIRRKILEWMADHVNDRFDSMGEMEAQAANFAKCSMPTARRWIFQFIQPDKPFWIEELSDFYVLRER